MNLRDKRHEPFDTVPVCTPSIDDERLAFPYPTLIIMLFVSLGLWAMILWALAILLPGWIF